MINTSSNTVTFAIPVGPGPFDVAVTPNGSALYVTDNSDASVTITETVPFPTTTVLVSTPEPSVFGQTKTLTATVTSSVGTPTGTVTFFDGGTPIGSATLNGSGVGTITTSTLAVGTHAMTAGYGGDTNFAPSTSAVDNQTVNKADTTTGLTSTPDPSVFGESKTLTATVTATLPGDGTPTGTVSFFDGLTLLGTAPLSGGVATFTISSLAVGAHALTATYNGDGDFNSSTSPVDNQTVNKADTTTSLVSVPDPSVFGQAKTLTATVTPVSPGAGTPTGTVTFFDGGTPIGSGTLNGSGVATLSISTLAVGAHALTATYNGDGDFNGSTSAVDSQTVNKAGTTTSLVSAPDPSVFGEAKTLTATVAAVSPGAGTPTGTVDFFDGGTPIGSATLNGSGVGTITVSNFAVGSHALTATYNGDSGFNGSTSAVDNQTVNKADTTTGLTSAPDPSVFGQAKTLTATVTPVSPGAGTPTGTVTFFDGGTPIGSGTLNGSGVATLSISTLAVGPHALTATYNGDGDFNGSTSAVDSQTVNKAGTTTSLVSAPDPSVFGEAKTLTATVAAVSPGAGTPTGTVDFFDGGTPIGSATLNGSGVATVTVSNFAVGSHALTATYNGDSGFNGSTSAVDNQTVNKAGTTTSLVSAPDPSVFGEAKTLTATVAAVSPGAGTPTGTVDFFDGGTPIGSATLIGGTATITTSTLAVGPHALTATYNGDGNFNSSTSPVDNQTVNKADTTTSLTSTPDPSAFGESKTLTATVTATLPGIGTPTGTVSFFDGLTLLGTAPLSGGVATFTISSLAVGPHALTATYNGDGDFNGSTSAVDNQTVIKAGTTTSLVSAPDPSVFGEAKTLTATVAAVSPGAGTPTGTVDFFDGGTPIGSGTLNGSGVATLSISTLAVGPHALTATYNGDGDFNGSTSVVDSQTVIKAGTTTSLVSAPDPSVFGEAKTLTATVAAVSPGAGTPTGTVDFFDGGTPIGSGTLNGSGVATLSISTLAVGPHAVTAVYAGDGDFNGSTSAVDNQVVNKADTTTGLTSAPDPSVFGQAKTLTATVTPVSPGAGTPTGTVTFFDGGTPVGTAVLSGGTATVTTSSLAVGPHAVTAVYAGDGDFNGSTSAVDNQVVNKADTTTGLTSAPDPSVFG
ncbi:Ig-like domain-containing protein, partial [Streptantibioticus ferralitis]|uniref:beta strand repeat-containing protein n=1 Tax=Streptantibioticus ferralitis TaxID=236510 RepID=UPI0031E20C67